MNSDTARARYIAAAALAGAVWFLFPLFLDYGVADMQSMSGIPEGGSAEALVCGMLTGIIIAFLFRPLFRKASQRVFVLLPFATLPTAIVIFSVLIWLTRQWLGVHSRFVGISELWEILSIYLIYGLFSIFSPILWGFAFLTEYLFRVFLTRQGLTMRCS